MERTFAHMYETGGMRRTHLRGHENILKRLVVHAGAFNLSLILRKHFGMGTPRGLQGCRRRYIEAIEALSLILAAETVYRRLSGQNADIGRDQMWALVNPSRRRCVYAWG